MYDRRRFLGVIGTTVVGTLSGCTSILGEDDDPADPPNTGTQPPSTGTQTQPPDTGTQSPANLASLGYPFEDYRESSEAFVEATHSLRIRNPSNISYTAAYVEYGDYPETTSRWLYNFSPSESRILTRYDPDDSEPDYQSSIVYPSLWPESLPSSVTTPSGINFLGASGTFPVVQATKESGRIRIPIPEEMADATISNVALSAAWSEPRIESESVSAPSDDSEYIKVSQSSLKPGYFGSNPFSLQLTGIENEFVGILTLPMPDFSVGNLQLTASSSDQALSWQQLSYDLTVGDALFSETPITHTVLGPSGGLLGQQTTRVKTGSKNNISVGGDWIESLDLPVDSKQATVIIQTPYPVAKHKTEFIVN